MKKKVVVLCMCLLAVLLLANPVEAKSKVTASLKKGVLTISGKGNMPKKMTFQGNKKIKKVVIKKGVTSIPAAAFFNCKNLKTVTIASSVKVIGESILNSCTSLQTLTLPGDFKIKTEYGDEAFYGINYSGKAVKVKFNSKLNVKVVSYILADNLEVSAKDPKFASQNGLIYTKDLKTLVRVPSERTTLSVPEGCETFCAQAVLYSTQDAEGDPILGCDKLTKIELPESLVRLEASQYPGVSENYSAIKEVVIHAKKLESESFLVLMNELNCVKVEALQQQFPEQITKDGDFYYTTDGLLLAYIGEAETVTVPKCVTEIGRNAFQKRDKVKEVILPDGITKIGDDAFNQCSALGKINFPLSLQKLGEWSFSSSALKEVALPESIQEVPAGCFAFIEELTKVTIPNSVKAIGNTAFASCAKLTDISLGANVETIGYEAFQMTAWVELRIPASVQTLEYGAFSYNTAAKKVIFEGSPKTMSTVAFEEVPNLEFIYQSGNPKDYRTCMRMEMKTASKNNKVEILFNYRKVKGCDGYQIKFSTSKNYKKNAKTMTVKAKTTSVRTKVPSQGQKEYVKIRPYTIVNGKKIYGRWMEDCF